MCQVGVCHVLGVSVASLTVEAFYALIGESIETHQPCVIGNHNLHSVYLYHHDPKMKAFYAVADYVFIDGMSLILWGRLMGFPLKRQNRFTSVDWLPPLMEICAAKGWRVLPGWRAKHSRNWCAKAVHEVPRPSNEDRSRLF